MRAVGDRHRSLLLWLPVVAGPALIFALLVRARPRHRARRLGSRPAEARARGRVRRARRACSCARPGASASRSRSGSRTPSSDEIHQTFVPGRAGLAARRRDRRGRRRLRGRALARAPLAPAARVSGAPVAIDLDGALGDTRPLWQAWLESVSGLLGVEDGGLPDDRGAAAAELDRRGAGNWRALLERFGEERAPVYLRRDPGASAALRALAHRRTRDRRLHRRARAARARRARAARRRPAGRGARDGRRRARAPARQLGADTVVVHTPAELQAASA